MKQSTKALNQRRQHVVSFIWRAGVIFILSLTAIAANAQSLINGGFETPDGLYTNAANPSAVTTGAANWVQFANGLRTSTTETGNPLTARTGSFSLKCFGSHELGWRRGLSSDKQWSDCGCNLCSQRLRSDSVQRSIDEYFAGCSDTTVWAYAARIPEQQRYSVGLSPLRRSLYSTNGLDVWLSGVVTAVAPATATQISVYVMELGFGTGSSGSIYWDDISVANLNAIPEPSTWSLLTNNQESRLNSRISTPRAAPRRWAFRPSIYLTLSRGLFVSNRM